MANSNPDTMKRWLIPTLTPDSDRFPQLLLNGVGLMSFWLHDEV